MAMGLPVIASNIGGLKEIIQNKKNGILINSLNDFEPDSKQFSIQILNLLENNSLYEKISKNARKRVLEHFSRDNMVQKYLIFLKTLTQFPPKGKSKTSLGIDCLT
jgi:spore coat protein SA